MTIDNLLLRAQETLRHNDAGVFTKPGPRQYPHQWNWDSALIALGLSHFDLPRALTEIRSLLSGQWRDGMLPHIVYHHLDSDYFPDPAFWMIENSPQAPDRPTSGITQPPILTTIVRRIHQRTPIPEFITEVYPTLYAWHRWLHTARNIDGSGLVAIIHPWESGTDDSPRWLSVLDRIQPEDLPEFHRGDLTHVSTDERPLGIDYERFIYLLDVFRKCNYDPQTIADRTPFLVQDVLFNAILYQANKDLLALAREIRQPVHEIEGWTQTVRKHFDTAFWDQESGLYYDYDLQRQRSIKVNTAATFLPLFAGLATKAQAVRLVEQQLNNPVKYAPNTNTPFMITTTSKTEPAWDARRYWRGPVWIILNWLVAEGLVNYGFHTLAEKIRADSLELIHRSGFREYYDPRDGSGCGSIDFSWSAALTIEWLSK
jgi:hypothetical protein